MSFVYALIPEKYTMCARFEGKSTNLWKSKIMVLKKGPKSVKNFTTKVPAVKEKDWCYIWDILWYFNWSFLLLHSKFW